MRIGTLILSFFLSFAGCSTISSRVPVRAGEYYVEAKGDRSLVLTLTYKPPHLLAADAAARMRNRLENEANIQAASELAKQFGGQVTLTFCATTIGLGNTKWLELIVTDRSGAVERHRGEFSTPEWSSGHRCWWNVFSKTLNAPIREYATVRVLHHVTNTYSEYVIWNGDFASQIGVTKPTAFQSLLGAR